MRGQVLQLEGVESEKGEGRTSVGVPLSSPHECLEITLNLLSNPFTQNNTLHLPHPPRLAKRPPLDPPSSVDDRLALL